jgi:Cu(I)/Ag(I) efflux system membrane fusion protein
MKSNFKYINQILCVLIFVLACVSCNKVKQMNDAHMHQETNMEEDMYTCPMHPEVVSDKPGSCPKCGMALVLKQNKKRIDTMATLIQPTNRIVLSLLTPIVASTGNHTSRISAMGYLSYNPNYVKTISARVSGRVEKNYIDYNFESVTKGQKLIDVYSPELLTAQNEYVYILQNNDASEVSTKMTLRSKLVNLGMSETEIIRLEKTKQTNATVSIYANSGGHVHFISDNTNMSEHALSLPSKNNASMNTSTEDKASIIRAGDYVKKGDDLFTIADESSIWALFKMLPEDIGSVHTGDAVDIIINDETYGGKVTFIEKSFNEATDFYTVRVSMICKDHTQLKIGTLIRGYISVKGNSNKNLWIPSTSIVYLGKGDAAVFIKKQLGYEAHTIQIGKQSNEWIEVLAGLAAIDSIAPIASYLVDSEGFISTDN